MFKKNVVPTWLSVLLLVLCTINVGSGIYEAVLYSKTFPVFSVTSVFGVLLNLSAIFYCVAGYKKNAAPLFKLYCILSLIAGIALLASELLVPGSGALWVIIVILTVLLVLVRAIFAFLPNLGRARSFSLLYAIYALLILSSIVTILMNPYALIGYGNAFINTIIFHIMLLGKYADKDARGTV